MTENNFSALMIKRALTTSDGWDDVILPGIYPTPEGHASSPDGSSGVLVVLPPSTNPLQRFTSSSSIEFTRRRTANTWSSWFITTQSVDNKKPDNKGNINLGLKEIGIGLPNMSDIANFDWQNFVFTTGANYVTSYNTWVNPPAGITYNAGTRVSIRVIYISTTNGPRMGLELTPDTGSSTNFKVYKLLCVGAAGSRVFTFNQDWNSANPIPVNGGGTGATTIAGALENLSLAYGSLIPIGVPLPYPLATPPAGFLKVNGSSFSTATYPKLALAYPSGVLPDLRAYTIRGWDDGRGIDAGRALLSEQLDALQNITGSLVDVQASTNPSGTGAFSASKVATGYTDLAVRASSIINISFDASRIARTAAETRMRNIAFNYIVRAI